MMCAIELSFLSPSMKALKFPHTYVLSSLFIFMLMVQAIPGVSKIKEGDNPATWMLEVSNVAVENRLGVDFAEIYEKSSLYRSVHSSFPLTLLSSLSFGKIVGSFVENRANTCLHFLSL
jgi:hypothetical protein